MVVSKSTLNVLSFVAVFVLQEIVSSDETFTSSFTLPASWDDCAEGWACIVQPLVRGRIMYDPGSKFTSSSTCRS